MGEADNSAVFEIPEDRAHDPREQERGFLRLPEDVKDELRDCWRFTEQIRAEIRRRRKRTLRIFLVESVVLLTLLSLFTPRVLPLAAFGFGLLGMIHQVQRADRTEL